MKIKRSKNIIEIKTDLTIKQARAEKKEKEKNRKRFLKSNLKDLKFYYKIIKRLLKNYNIINKDLKNNVFDLMDLIENKLKNII